jgi:hypothetical protein
MTIGRKVAREAASGGRRKQAWRLQMPHRLCRRAGFGINEVIGIAAGIIIAVVIVIPGLQGFADSILQDLSAWRNDMASSIFSVS